MFSAFLLSYISSSLLSPEESSSAVTCDNGMTSSTTDVCGTDNTDVNVSIEGSWTVSISSAGTLGVNITPTSSGVVNTAVDNVNIYTNTPNGYQLYLNSTTGSTDIYNNTDTEHERNHFTATTGTKASPVSLTSNSWGYSLASSPTTFSKVEASSSAADSLISSGSKTSGTGDNLGVTYGFKADAKLTPGTYTTSVTYTAVAEVPSYTISSISPNQLYTNDQSNKQVTILTTTPSTELGLGDITAKITNAASTTEETNTNTAILTNCTEIISGGYRGATCTFNGSLVYGTYNVILTSSWHASTYTLVDGFNMRDHRTMSNITYMQEMNSDICENTTQATTTGANIYNLTDNRGSKKSYKVAKLADNNCWMVSNLALDGGVTISGADSNLPEGTSVDLPATKSNGGSSGAEMQIWAQQSGYDGNYYNWCAAIANMTNCDSTLHQSTSICPKNWILPSNTDNHSYDHLFNLAGINSLSNPNTKISTVKNNPYAFTSSGNYVNGYSQQNIEGNYWIAMPSDSGHAYVFFFFPDYFNPKYTNGKALGASVRCVFGS